MSPFSKLLRQFRENRGLRQKDLAELLGYEQSYISALENGQKGIPRQEFIQTFIKKLHLNEDEIEAMNTALAVSRRTIQIPNTATEDEFKLAHSLERLFGKLSAKQIQFLCLAVELSSADARGAQIQSEKLREVRM